MKILGLAAALGPTSAAIVEDGHVLAELTRPAALGQAGALPALVEEALAKAGLTPAQLGAIAVDIGPGSFTGLRAAIAFAQGLGDGLGIPVGGITIAEALAMALPALDGRTLWTAIDSRRGRVFLDRAGSIEAFPLSDLPLPGRTRVAIAGDAAIEVASRLAARGADVMLTAARIPAGHHLALALSRSLREGHAPRPAQPLYIDPPEAKPPADPRPAPIG